MYTPVGKQREKGWGSSQLAPLAAPGTLMPGPEEVGVGPAVPAFREWYPASQSKLRLDPVGLFNVALLPRSCSQGYSLQGQP